MKAGDDIFIVEEDGSATPGTYISPSVWPGHCRVQASSSYAQRYGVDENPRAWAKRNVISVETGERLV